MRMDGQAIDPLPKSRSDPGGQLGASMPVMRLNVVVLPAPFGADDGEDFAMADVEASNLPQR